jgi:hypothetical protein
MFADPLITEIAPPPDHEPEVPELLRKIQDVKSADPSTEIAPPPVKPGQKPFCIVTPVMERLLPL